MAKVQAPKALSSRNRGIFRIYEHAGAARKGRPGDLAPGTDRTSELLTPGRFSKGEWRRTEGGPSPGTWACRPLITIFSSREREVLRVSRRKSVFRGLPPPSTHIKPPAAGRLRHAALLMPPAAAGQPTGYTDRQLSDNRWRVTFTGNSVTPRETVEDDLLLRAAEVTLGGRHTAFPVRHPRHPGPDHTMTPCLTAPVPIWAFTAIGDSARAGVMGRCL